MARLPIPCRSEQAARRLEGVTRIDGMIHRRRGSPHPVQPVVSGPPPVTAQSWSPRR